MLLLRLASGRTAALGICVLLLAAALAGTICGYYWYTLLHPQPHQESLISPRVDFYTDRITASAWGLVATILAASAALRARTLIKGRPI